MPLPEAAAHELAALRDDGQAAFDRLHHRVEAGEADRVEEHVRLRQRAEEAPALEPGRENEVGIGIEARAAECPGQPREQLRAERRRLCIAEDQELRRRHLARDAHQHRIVLWRVLERRAGADEQRRAGSHAQDSSARSSAAAAGRTASGATQQPSPGSRTSDSEYRMDGADAASGPASVSNSSAER
jgi:hypothetical protein